MYLTLFFDTASPAHPPIFTSPTLEFPVSTLKLVPLGPWRKIISPLMELVYTMVFILSI